MNDDKGINKDKLAFTPAVVMLVVGGLGWLLLGSLIDWDPVNAFLKTPGNSLYGVLVTLGVVLAVEYVIICLLHRQPDTRRKVAWDLLSPTVTMVAAGTIIMIGVKVNNSLTTDTEKISRQLEDLSKKLGGPLANMDTPSIANELTNIGIKIETLGDLTTSLPAKLEALETTLSNLRPINIDEREIKEAINELRVQGQASTEQLKKIVTSVNSLTLSPPLRISVKDDLNPILGRLEYRLEESAKASVQAIRDHGDGLAKLESVQRKRYERKVELGSRNFFKKTKQFFFGMKDNDTSKCAGDFP